MKSDLKSSNLWKKVLVGPDSNISLVIKKLNKFATQIVLVVNSKKKLLGTITDGDIRRALMSGLNLNSDIKSVYNRNPFVASISINKFSIKNLMLMNKINQIPIVNKKREVVGLYSILEIEELDKQEETFFVIMAGGRGKRMLPLTKTVPKPLLKVNGKPIIQHIIERARDNGFNNFIITINYLGKLIKKYLSDGKKLGVKIEYVSEKKPLGTAGSLGLLKTKIKKHFLVSNGDVITNIDYSKFLDFHKNNNSYATMAVKTIRWKNPYGKIETEKMKIKGFDEKPSKIDYVNAGIYVLDPKVLNMINGKSKLDMPDVFKKLKRKKEDLYVFPLHESWMDLGSKVSLKNANKLKK